MIGRRAQANLIAFGVAVLLVTAAAGLSVAVTAGAFAAADRDPTDRRVAVDLADRLVNPTGPVARAPNALDEDRLDAINASDLNELTPGTVAVTVRLSDGVVAQRGHPTDGYTVRRLVIVEDPTERKRNVSVRGAETTVTLTDTTRTIKLNGTHRAGVTAVAVNGRTVRREPGGIHGPIRIPVDPTRPPTVTLYGPTDAEGTVTVSTFPWVSEPAVLAVTVDA